MLSIITTLIIIDPIIAAPFVSFGLIYLLIILFTRKRLHLNGLLITRKSDLVIKSTRGLGGEVLVSGSQIIYKKYLVILFFL